MDPISRQVYNPQKKARLNARTRRVRSRLAGRERKTDTRRKILVGAMTLKLADQYPKTKDFMLRNLDAFLEHPRDRALARPICAGLHPFRSWPGMSGKRQWNT